MYEDYGTKTCAGYPGSLGHLKIDAETFAFWNIDYLKLDACYVDDKKIPQGHFQMEKYLNFTGRPIVYSCCIPGFVASRVDKINLTQISQHCNLWRNYWDIEKSWKSVMNVIDFFNKHQDKLANVNGPGSWNDPDMVSNFEKKKIN